ncbi:unnamed protein product [Ilex paraguariensis]|uniref:RING-type E3 ubiquitin transferase n=1 Tax=Ilex paraguariensis TaxID=185542 RepID=A0ABC8RCK3_9AQUA
MSSAPSQPEMSSESSSPTSQEQLRTRVILVPWIIGFATAAPSQDHHQQQQQPPPPADQDRIDQESIIFTNGFRNAFMDPIMMIDGYGELLESVFRDFGNKDGSLPASKASIEAMPMVKVTEQGAECAICLCEYEICEEVKEMPCRHRYHSDCIGKWLGIHGSCPLCRYKMPVENSEESKKLGGGGVDDEDWRFGGDIRVVFSNSEDGAAGESDGSST